MKRIAVLGSTGSIGINALKVISKYPRRFKVTALACASNSKLLAKQAKRFKPKVLGINDTSKIRGLRDNLGGMNCRILGGIEALEEIAGSGYADLILIAISGNISLLPLIKAIEAKKEIALASKEPLVSAGDIVMRLAKKKGVDIIPVDSEHSAIFQCLAGRDAKELKNIYLTGSGGPLRSVKRSLFDALPAARVLAHPKWRMGRKISVDSATLMNKGLEVIEAKHLFNVPEKRIKVLVHPEAIVHSMVEFIDGAILAQLAIPDMRLPIQYALNYPKRLNSNQYKTDFAELKSLSFHEPDFKKFPCLSLAYEASRVGGTMPAVLNASNEEAVRSYLDGTLNFTGIPRLVEKVLKGHKVINKPVLGDIMDADKWARIESGRIIRSI